MMELSGGSFLEGVFNMGGTFHGGVSHKGREFFMKGEPGFLALFEKANRK